MEICETAKDWRDRRIIDARAAELAEFPTDIRNHVTFHDAESGRIATAAARWIFRPAINVWTRTQGFAWPLRLIDDTARIFPLPRGTTIASVRVPHRRAELICASRGLTEAAASNPRWSATRAVLYLHGGAFVACGLNSHRPIAARISQTAGSVVLNLEYRMLPLHPLTDAVEDAVAAYRWLYARGFNSIVLAGDSAGGYLAFMTALALRKSGLPAPAGIVAMSPLTDLDVERKARHRNADRCALFTLQAVEAFIEHLHVVQARFADDGKWTSLQSPVDADLSAMPPVQIHAGAEELLLQDAEFMTERLVAAGRPVDLHVWKGQIHAFPAAAFATRPALEAVAAIGEFVRQVTPTGLALAA